jgi:hypothetical protein
MDLIIGDFKEFKVSENSCLHDILADLEDRVRLRKKESRGMSDSISEGSQDCESATEQSVKSLLMKGI